MKLRKAKFFVSISFADFFKGKFENECIYKNHKLYQVYKKDELYSVLKLYSYK